MATYLVYLDIQIAEATARELFTLCKPVIGNMTHDEVKKYL